jgi:hypothetical protein
VPLVEPERSREEIREFRPHQFGLALEATATI